MANLSTLFGGKTFKPAEVEEVNTDFSPLPKGDYHVQITDSEIKPTSTGNGTLLTLKLMVQDGKFKNRIVFENLCVQHTNATAQAIAQTRLKQICESLKLAQLKDSSQLHDKDLLVKLDVEFDDFQSKKNNTETYRNAIKGYSPFIGEPALADGDDFEDDVPF